MSASVFAQSNAQTAWKKSWMEFGKLTPNQSFAFELSPQVVNPSGKPFTIEVRNNPSWLHFDSAKNVLSGTPGVNDTGLFRVDLQIVGRPPAIAAGSGQVVAVGARGPGKTPPPPRGAGSPPIWLTDPLPLPDASTGVAFKYDLTTNARSLDGLALTYKILSGAPTWLTLSTDGKLSGTPTAVSQYALVVEVSDGTNSAQGGVTGQVVASSQAPIWLEDPLRFDAKAGTPFKQNIAAKVTDKSGRAVTFSKIKGGGWLSVSTAGDLTGTPGQQSVGDQSFVVGASNGLGTAPVTVIVTVESSNRAPVWSADPIALPKGQVQTFYKASVASYATDPDGDPVTFAKMAGANWATISPDGIVQGTPRVGDEGPNSLRVRAQDPHGAWADVTVNIQIDKAASAPVWKIAEPIPLDDVQIGRNLGVSLLDKVTNPQSARMTFRKVQGPTWLLVSADGQVTGMPGPNDLGNYVAIIEATNGKASQAGFAGRVIPINHPPEIVAGSLNFTVPERSVFKLNLNQTGFVTDQDGDPLTFTLSASDWATVTTNGALTLSPAYAQIGTQSLDLTVTDGKDTIQGKIAVTVTRDPRPPKWNEDPMKLTFPAGVPFVGTLKGKAVDRDGLPVTYALKSGPAWLAIDSTGNFKGSAGDDSVGDNAFVVTVANDKVGADAALIVTITSDNSPPQWTKNPVVLPSGKAGKTYAQSLKAYAIDPDPGDEVTFEKLDGPAWAFVTTAGLVIGSPDEKDAVLNVLKVRASDQRRAHADATVQIQVDSKNNPPRWIQDPIALGNPRAGVRYAYDLSVLAVDDDGDPLSFKKTDGPTWLQVSSNGALTGTPRDADGGPFTAVFEVSDGKASASVNASGKVLGANHPPVWNPDALSFGLASGETLTINLNQDKYVKDPDGDPLTFKLLTPFSWVSLDATGALTLTPADTNRGTFKISVEAMDDGKLTAEAILTVVVDKTSRPPIWLFDPIELTANVDAPFTDDLTKYARDLGTPALPLTFTKTAGPDWLAVNPNGQISGRPTAAEASAPQVFTLSVSNGNLSAEAKAIVTVQGASVVRDRYRLNAPMKDAPVDLLFVVENTPAQAGYYERMKSTVAGLFDSLDEASVRYSVGVLSSRNFLGRTMAASTGADRASYAYDNPSGEFSRMLDAARVRPNEYFHSPIWALDRFFTSERYAPEVPLIVFVHTAHFDQFEALQKGSRGEGATTADVGRGFVSYHAKMKKPLVLYVNDMSCDPKIAAVHKPLVKATNGLLLLSNPCGPNFGDWMSGFGKEVISQSYRFAKRLLAMSKVPRDPRKIKLSLQSGKISYPLNGNTGADTDKWHYDAKENALAIHWWNIHLPYKAATDELVAEY